MKNRPNKLRYYCSDTDLSFQKRRAPHRLAASFLFLANGMTFGTWAALIPSFKEKFALNDSTLSMVLIGLMVGALVSMPFAGKTIAAKGSRFVLYWVAPVFCAWLIVLSLAPSFMMLFACAILFGVVKSSFDVAANAQALAIEKLEDHSVIASFQALWSAGGLTAAGIVAALIWLGVSSVWISIGIGMPLWVGSLIACRNLVSGDHSTMPAPFWRFQAPSPAILRISILAFMALFVEGILIDWSSVYCRNTSNAPAWIAPLGYAAFCLAMTGGRLVGDRVMTEYGSPATLSISGWLACSGLLLAALLPWLPAVLIGIFLTGLGLANLVPIFLRASSEAAGVGKGGEAIAFVSMVGYTGFLAGPATVGVSSHWMGLTGAILVAAMFCGAIAMSTPFVFWKAGGMKVGGRRQTSHLMGTD